MFNHFFFSRGGDIFLSIFLHPLLGCFVSLENQGHMKVLKSPHLISDANDDLTVTFRSSRRLLPFSLVVSYLFFMKAYIIFSH